MVFSCNGTPRAAASRRTALVPSQLHSLPAFRTRTALVQPRPIIASCRTLRTRPLSALGKGTPHTPTSLRHDTHMSSFASTSFQPSTSLSSLPNQLDPDDESLPYMFRMRRRYCPLCASHFFSDRSLHSHISRNHPNQAETIMMDLLRLKPLAGTWRTETISAQIDRTTPDHPQLSLYICRKNPKQIPGVTKIRDNSATPFRIDVETFKMNSHIDYQHSKQRLKELGGPQNQDPEVQQYWTRIVRWLHYHTAQTDPAWIETTIHGSSWHLLDFYHHILSKFQGRVTPVHPVVAFDAGTMVLFCHPDNVATVRDEYEQRLREFGDDPSPHDIIKPPERTARLQWVLHPPSRDLSDYLRPPERWSKESLLKHVENMTNILRSATMAPWGNDDAYIQSALEEILFATDLAKPFVSWAALHKAFSFIVKRRPIEETWRFIGRMEEAGFTPNVEFYATFLTVRNSDDYTAISQILADMARRRVMANSSIWVAIAGAAPSPNDNSRLLRMMQSQSLLMDPEVEHRMAEVVIKNTFGTFLDRGGLISSFVSVLDSSFPRGWLSGGAVAELIGALGRRLRLLDAILLTDSLSPRWKMLSATGNRLILRALVEFCSYQSNTDLAVWTMVYAVQRWQLEPLDQGVIQALLHAAWESQMHNVFRVAWRYGVSVGEIDGKTHKRVFRSLLTRSERRSSRFDAIWLESAGPVACNRDPDAPSTDALTPTKILEREYKSFFWEEPSEWFPAALAKALVMDKLWRVNGQHLSATSLEWKQENAIEIHKKVKRWAGWR